MTVIRNIALIFFVALLSFNTLASNKIKITVQTSYKKADGLGFVVDGKKQGSLGRKFTGRGPKGKVYEFGYRVGLFHGKNIDCGDLYLEKDSLVTLITDGKICRATIA